MQKLLVKVRGPKEAVEAVRGGASIVDAEYPASALGTTYPLNILAIREKLRDSGFESVLVSTSIGDKPFDRALACQAALGMATAGADAIIFGLAELPLKAAAYLGDSLVRTVRKIYPEKIVIPAVFVDTDMQRYFDPFKDGIELLRAIKPDGLLLDIYNKLIDKGLLDYCRPSDLSLFAEECHSLGMQAWISGSISKGELSRLWPTGVDVIGVREAACTRKANGRLGEVKAEIVRELVSSAPKQP